MSVYYFIRVSPPHSENFLNHVIFDGCVNTVNVFCFGRTFRSFLTFFTVNNLRMSSLIESLMDWLIHSVNGFQARPQTGPQEGMWDPQVWSLGMIQGLEFSSHRQKINPTECAGPRKPPTVTLVWSMWGWEITVKHWFPTQIWGPKTHVCGQTSTQKDCAGPVGGTIPRRAHLSLYDTWTLICVSAITRRLNFLRD